MLLKHTEGEAHELIKNCILMASADEAYAAAVQLLKSTYGHPSMLAESYKKQAQKWPLLKPGDKAALRKYSVFLTSFTNARKGNPELIIQRIIQQHFKRILNF